MADALLPAAGWYADGSTVGVRRWFDGTAWTEHTTPDPARVPDPRFEHAYATEAPDGRFATTPDSRFATTPDSRFATTSGTTYGATLPPRLILGLSPEDSEARDAAIQAHAIRDARRVRRGAIGAFCCALVVLSVTSGMSLALRSPDELWIGGAVGAGYLVWRARRDYGRAVFRGAARLPAVTIALATVGLVAGVAVFAAVPIETARSASHAVHDVTDLSGLSGLTGLPGLPGLPDPSAPAG